MNTLNSPLQDYERKRDFTRTREPRPGRRSEKSGDYMVHLHDARTRHFDLRLQWKGVLKSWAVPKGPSFHPEDKRLAVRTEDHPDEYKNYEGVIPEKNYGAGPSLIWDVGEFQPLSDFDEGFRKGHLRFRIEGIKLKGIWNLVRTGIRGKKDQWLLIKERDEFADWEENISEDYPESVVSGRTLAELEAEDQKLISEVEFTSPEKVLFKDMGLTKRDLWGYYQSVWPAFFRFAEEAPLSLVRCPQGRHKNCFFQKHLDKDIRHPQVIEIQEKQKTGLYSFLKEPDDLKALIQIGVLEYHVWNSRVEDLECPLYVVFDLDPGEGVGFADVVKAAWKVKKTLESKRHGAFVRTTGGKGLHILAPVSRKSWGQAYEFSKQIAMELEKKHPDFFVATSPKAKRKNKVFIDYLRNSRGSTSIANYSTRAKKGAPVATPLAWEEVSEKLDPKKFNIQTVLERLTRQKQDPWKGFWNSINK